MQFNLMMRYVADPILTFNANNWDEAYDIAIKHAGMSHGCDIDAVSNDVSFMWDEVGDQRINEYQLIADDANLLPWE